MFKYLLSALLLINMAANAQKNETNTNEAKAAYLLAEESYGKSDYASTLKYLQNAKKSLGRVNSKILYLQIQAEAEMAKGKPELISNVLKTIAAFETAPDIKTFNEEKVIEVLKMKIVLTTQNEELAARIKKNADAVARGKQTFEKMTFNNWPFGITLNQLQLSHKDSIMFQKRPKSRLEKDLGLTLYSIPAASFSGNSVVPDTYSARNIFGVLVKADTVKGYRRVYYHADQKTGGSYNEASEWVKKYLQYVTNLLYKKAIFKPENAKANYDQYIWVEGNKTFTIYYLHRYQKPTFWVQAIVTEIRYN